MTPVRETSVHLKSHFLGLGSFESETSPLCQQGLRECLIYYTTSDSPRGKKNHWDFFISNHLDDFFFMK